VPTGVITVSSGADTTKRIGSCSPVERARAGVTDRDARVIAREGRVRAAFRPHREFTDRERVREPRRSADGAEAGFIKYDSSTGDLYYDATAPRQAALTQFATLTVLRPSTRNDFQVGA